MRSQQVREALASAPLRACLPLPTSPRGPPGQPETEVLASPCLTGLEVIGPSDFPEEGGVRLWARLLPDMNGRRNRRSLLKLPPPLPESPSLELHALRQARHGSR